MDKPIKCFIVEGEDRDYRFISGMISTFFKGKYESVTVCLPAEQNIYMLYNKLKEDNFETDLIELLREDKNNTAAIRALEGIERQRIDEIYLFFDYDIHQDNLPSAQNPVEVLKSMLEFYSNETEHGKLYLSYPMVEALYDYRDGYCEAATDCWFPVNEIGDYYKTKAGQYGHHSSRHMLRYEEWREIIAVFGLRIQCLFGVDRINHTFFKDNVTTTAIFDRQKELLLQKNAVFVLSAIPEFLLDYFRSSFWNSHVNRHRNKYNHCPKNN